jgi:hypothetical protein
VKLTRSLSSPARLAGGDSKPKTLRREDNFLTDASFMKKGKENKKSHVSLEQENRGSLLPANKQGDATPYDHVQGNVEQKARSPYTSFTPGEHRSDKVYGKYEVEVNRSKLEADLKSGKLQGVEVLDNRQVQQFIKDDALARTGVRVSQPVAQDKVDEFVKGQGGLSKSKQKALEGRLVALANTNRDQEVLVKGEIPTEYIRRVGVHRDTYAQLKSELVDEVKRRHGGQLPG